MKARFCPHCGAGTSNDYVFCPNCGTKLPEVASPSAGQPGAESVNLGVPNDRKVARQDRGASGATTEIVTCPTCGFQNRSDSRSCESCGASLKGAARAAGVQQAPQATEETVSSDIPRAVPEQKGFRNSLSGKEKRRESRPSAANARKGFHFTTVQVVSVAAALFLGAVLVYGIVTSRSATPQQDNSSGPDAQQQTTASQPSADVLHEIDRLRQVVDKNPSDLVSTLHLSNMLQDNGFYDQAAIYYKRYLDKMPDNADARVDYGVTLFEGGHTQDAIAQLTQALKMNPKHQIGYFNLGIVYLNAGEFDKANAAFKKCVSIDPNSDIGKKAEQTLEQHANIKN
jgi:Tfp pilus assembly protein PilF